jgi:hypothetical protein
MLGTLTFPADSAAAVAGNFGRIAPVPDFMKLIGPYVRSSIEGGISTISIYECDDARADEAVDYLKPALRDLRGHPGSHREHRGMARGRTWCCSCWTRRSRSRPRSKRCRSASEAP